MAKKLSGSGSAVSARERARLARRRVDAERIQRDLAIEDATAAYIESDDRRAALLEQVTEEERNMSRSLWALISLREPRSRIAALLGIDRKELGRLLDLTAADVNGDTLETGVVSDSGDNESLQSPERNEAPVSVDAGRETA